MLKALNDQKRLLRTTVGEFALDEYRLRLTEREWTIRHVGAVLSYADESQFLVELLNRLPYGVALWPAAIALAHEVALHADSLPGARVLELGAGTGLPGIVAASLGARVVQTDRNKLVMHLCQLNGTLNHIDTIEYRLVDWTSWEDPTRYDLILGSDILYAEEMHSHLRRIFESNLTAGGRILLSDPFRAASIRLLEDMEVDGWSVTLTKWMVGEETTPRPIGLFELRSSV